MDTRLKVGDFCKKREWEQVESGPEIKVYFLQI